MLQHSDSIAGAAEQTASTCSAVPLATLAAWTSFSCHIWWKFNGSSSSLALASCEHVRQECWRHAQHVDTTWRRTLEALAAAVCCMQRPTQLLADRTGEGGSVNPAAAWRAAPLLRLSLLGGSGGMPSERLRMLGGTDARAGEKLWDRTLLRPPAAASLPCPAAGHTTCCMLCQATVSAPLPLPTPAPVLPSPKGLL
jgi:hypothetical protein